jgi:sugar fermentation stimulation protein A
MDSQAPNAAAKEWLLAGGLGAIEDLKAEVFHGDSRFDFAFTKDGKPCFLEVKGVTLENDGVCAFPDAPTQRGAKHLHHLTQLAGQGYGAYVLFVIQMDGVQHLHPNDATDPAFGNALRQAAAAGVQVMAMDCRVEPDSMALSQPVAVIL